MSFVQKEKKKRFRKRKNYGLSAKRLDLKVLFGSHRVWPGKQGSSLNSGLELNVLPFFQISHLFLQMSL